MVCVYLGTLDVMPIYSRLVLNLAHKLGTWVHFPGNPLNPTHCLVSIIYRRPTIVVRPDELLRLTTRRLSNLGCRKGDQVNYKITIKLLYSVAVYEC